MADDIYSLLMADEPTAQEQAQAMAQALRRQRAAGNLALLTGDKVLGRFGQAQLEGAGAQEGMLAQAGGQQAQTRLRRALEADAARRAEANAQRARAWETQDKATQRAFESEQNALNRTSHERAAALSAGQRATAGTTIPGLEVSQGAAPTTEDAKKVKASLASAERMKRYVGELRELHAKHGTEYGGPAGTRMGQLAKAITLEAKNIGELGALSGPDMGLVDALTGDDPSSLGANLKAMVGVDNTATSLDGLDKWVGDTLSANIQAYGYQPPKQRGETVTPGPAAAPATASPGRKRVRDASGRTGWWDGKSPLPKGVEVLDG